MVDLDSGPDTDYIESMHEDAIRTDLTEAMDHYDNAMLSEQSVDNVCASDVLVRIQHKLLEKMAQPMCTGQLWVQYMGMVNILRQFLKAEQTGNWQLHLKSVHEMLPYFAASGHTLYAKSAYIYLQMMLRLPETHPDVYKKFEEGFHVVRHSDRYWTGLSTDLIIEQVLMQSVETHGGLTRGKGMTETQQLIWVFSMPACAAMNEAMKNLSGISYETSDQHKDISIA